MDHINEHCNLYMLLPDYQSVNCNEYSCETAIVKLVNDLLWAMGNQQVTAIMDLHLSAAFAMVKHEVLLSVLKHNFRLEDTVLNWFDLYLCPRSTRLTLDESTHQNEIFPSVYHRHPV